MQNYVSPLAGFSSYASPALRPTPLNIALLDDAIQAVNEAEAHGQARIAATPGMLQTFEMLSHDISERLDDYSATKRRFAELFAGRLYGYDRLGERYYLIEDTQYGWPYNNTVYIRVGVYGQHMRRAGPM